MTNPEGSASSTREGKPQNGEALCRVVLHSDEITPMEFVVRVLQRFFMLNQAAATEIMYNAHFHGTAYVQTLPRKVAANRVAMARFAAGIENYPLTFSLESPAPAD